MLKNDVIDFLAVSGKNQRKFCESAGINASQFNIWIRKDYDFTDENLTKIENALKKEKDKLKEFLKND